MTGQPTQYTKLRASGSGEKTHCNSLRQLLTAAFFYGNLPEVKNMHDDNLTDDELAKKKKREQLIEDVLNEMKGDDPVADVKGIGGVHVGFEDLI